jgi:magnesium transporter
MHAASPSPSTPGPLQHVRLGRRAGGRHRTERIRDHLREPARHAGGSAELPLRLSAAGTRRALNRRGGERLWEDSKTHLQTLDRDVRSLADYNAQFSAEVGFLLEEMLDLVGAEQNRISKASSVAAVMFLPPTLVGTVNGMNFEHMPELRSSSGYPFALALIVLLRLPPDRGGSPQT